MKRWITPRTARWTALVAGLAMVGAPAAAPASTECDSPVAGAGAGAVTLPPEIFWGELIGRPAPALTRAQQGSLERT